MSKSDILSKHAKRFNFDELSLCDRKYSLNVSDQLDEQPGTAPGKPEEG